MFRNSRIRDSEDPTNFTHLQTLNLTEKELETLTDENFAVNTKLGFDIRNASQLRWFLSDLLYIRAKATNLILLSFDHEDSLNCQTWNVGINFNFEDDEDVIISKSTEYSTIPCEKSWKEMIGYFTDRDEAPVRQKVAVINHSGILLPQLHFSLLQSVHLLFRCWAYPPNFQTAAFRKTEID